MTLSTPEPRTAPEPPGLADLPAGSNRRWWVAGMLFLAAVLNYIDRSILGLLAPTIQKELGISDAAYAHVVDAFLVAYTISYLFSGRLVDWIGPRASMALFLGFWSAANALTAAARSAVSLGVYRFLLGLGEAGGYTASPKAVSQWFVAKERAFAVGLYSIGSSVGATVAPLLVLATSNRFGWRAAFVITGLLGLAWVIPWLLIARRPGGAAVEAAADARPVADESEWALWRDIMRRPLVWRLMLARLLTDSVWYFYLFWMPKYLHDARGVEQTGLAIMWVIFLAADVGFLGGGFLSDRLVRRGLTPPASRVGLMAAAACLVPVSALVPFAPSLPFVLACASVVAMAHCAWLGNLSALVVDAIPARTLATTFGFIAAGSAAGGIAMNAVVSAAVQGYSYDRVFFLMACLHPLALLLVWPLRRSPASPETA
jgi:ACS family hexuronate transporter-like MFS transporter